MKSHRESERETQGKQPFFALQAGRIACLHCGWSFTGSFDEGRRRAARHREQKHPPLSSPRRGMEERDERELELRLEGRRWPAVGE